MLKLTRITNVFTLKRREWDAHAGLTLRSYLPNRFRVDRGGIVEVNGERVTDLDIVPKDGSNIVFAHVPQLGSLLVLIVLQAIGIGLSILLRPKPPSLVGPGKEDEPDRSFLGPSTRVGPNTPVPVILGQVRSGGHIIESFTETHLDVDGGVEIIDPVYEIQKVEVGPAPQQAVHRFPKRVHKLPVLVQPVTGREVLNTRVAWSWGPIEEIGDPEIDGNPLQNFRDITYEWKQGNDSDGLLFGFSEQKDQNQPGLPALVEKDTPITRSTAKVVQGIEIAIEFTGGLFKLNKVGKLRNQEVDFQIEYKKTTDATWTLFQPLQFPTGTLNVSARTRAPHVRWIRLPKLDHDFYDIRVTRISDDNTNAPRRQDEFTWKFLQEIISGGRAHPGLAETGFRQVPQDQTRAPRNFTALIKGLNDIRVYKNDLTYDVKYTDNPAWLFMRVMTDEFWGFGKFFTYDDSFNFTDFLNLAAHCDTLVDDGTNAGRLEFDPLSVEKRCIMGLELRDSATMEQIVELFNLAADCRFYLDGDKWRVDINEDKTSELVITEGSYHRNSLEWRFPDIRERSTRLVGRFRNQNNKFDEDEVTIVDQEVAAGTRHLTTNVSLQGITRPSQALRTLAKIVNFNRISDELVQFTVGLTSLDLRIGSIFQLESETSGKIVASGRMLEFSPGRDKIRLDSELRLDTSKSYTLSVQYVDRSTQTFSLINLPSEKTDWVEISPTWSQAPLAGDEYYLVESTVEKSLFRVEEISLEEDLNRQIFASKYSNDINDVDVNFEIQNRNTIFDEDAIPAAVTNLTVTEPLDEDDPTIGQGLNVSWDCPPGEIAGAEVWFQEDGDTSWIYRDFTEGCSTEIPVDELEENVTYRVAVRARSPRGAQLPLDDAAQATFTTTGPAEGS